MVHVELLSARELVEGLYGDIVDLLSARDSRGSVGC